ncbi:MAG: hypothetical protein CME62_00670 [Halobacteriovoraceae bacterium]|nr:hypothetical protein [Halobacteriovoraceae bacterium]|tara:strand:- start:25001 stop:25684 length:684 start_codon:yes stop_codon:yes gene_type:complete
MSGIKLKYPPAYPVFFLGGSAGAVEAFKEIAHALPNDFPAPLFFILHRKKGGENKQNLLPDIIRNVTDLEVCEPEDGEIVRSRRIYIAPIDKHLYVEDNRIYLRDEPEESAWRPSINVLFKSGAKEYKQRTVCVLLTGLLDDGVDGLISCTKHGGVTIAQSPEDAYQPNLPLNAILKDHPSYVAPIKDMALLLCELAQYEGEAELTRSIIEKAALTARLEKKALKEK